MFLKMLLRQARFRWQVTALLWLAMTALVSLYVYVDNSARFSNRSMQLIMKQMGHNLIILPENAKPRDTYLCTDAQLHFPDTVTAEMAKHLELDSKYYLSVLQEQVQVEEKLLIVTGIRPVHRADESAEKGHLTEPVLPGRARLGRRAAELLEKSAGASVQVGTESFKVARVLDSQGTLDDYRVYLNLSDAQDVLDKPNRINAIQAFLCMHGGTLEEVMHHQRQGMQKLAPGFQVIAVRNIARGRDLARRTTSGYLYYLLGLVFGITVVIIVVTGLQEVSDRRQEVGILLAMGASYAGIVGLYVAKLFVLAMLAALTGFVIGSLLSREFLSPMLITHTRPVAVLWGQFPRVVLLTCAVVVAAAFLPMVKLVRLDPNEILTEE
jgi:hypothetical protein